MSLQVRNSPIHGKGVFTTQSIEKHSVISRVKTVREITDSAPLDPDKGELFHHCTWYPDGTMVLLDQPHRYLNHSCMPNTFSYSINRVYYLMAMRDIQEDEELTVEYNLSVPGVDEGEPGEPFDCDCGSSNCPGHLRIGFFYMSDSQKMKYLPYLDPWRAQVHSNRLEAFVNRQLADPEGA